MDWRVFFGVLAFSFVFVAAGSGACAMATIGDRGAWRFFAATAVSIVLLATFASLAASA